MATVDVGKCRSLIDIERVLSLIADKPEGDKFVFPLDCLKARHGPMHDASRLQMIVTLARQRLNADYLDIHPNASDQAAIEAVCSYSPGIAGVRIAQGVRIGKQEIHRREVLRAAVAKMQATDAGDFDQVIHGRSLDLICVAASKVQYLRPLFESHRVVKEPTEMQKTMATLVNFINKQSQDKVPDSLVASLGLFSSELMQNTQEHALKDHAGKPYLAHVEGMMLGWTRFNEELYSEDFSGKDSLSAYWDKESGRTGSGVTSLRAFEVSYFDSGPGLVGRFTGRSSTAMSIQEERKFLIECLQHKATSKPESAAGEGLPSVLNELKKVGGLIRIRSGRLSLFNAFMRGDTQRDIFNFEDWTEAPLAPAQGAVISILVPLRAE